MFDKAYQVHVGGVYNPISDFDGNENQMAKTKCDCYHTYEYQGIGIDGEPYVTVRPVCYGTREREDCSCGADETKCDFYPDKRIKAALNISKTGVLTPCDKEPKEWIETPLDDAHTPTKRFKCPWCGKRTGTHNAMAWKYCPYCGNPVKIAK